jgi:hypothetical protein
MEKLKMRIQRNNNLNDVFFDDTIGPGNGRHKYIITVNDCVCLDEEGIQEPNIILGEIEYQKGPRNAEGSVRGVLDQDLLEIVRHRLQCFQQGEYATRENAIALTHIEEALLWMAKRANDRAERGVLGTMNK